MQSNNAVDPLMTIICQRENGGVEQLYLFTDGVSKEEKPFIIWHVRDLEKQHFAHFYISKDCFLLNSVWAKQISTSESEFMSNFIVTKRMELQAHFLKQFDKAAVLCGFDNFETFVRASLQNGKLHA